MAKQKPSTTVEFIPNGNIKITAAGADIVYIDRRHHLELLRLLLTRQDNHTIATTPPFVLLVRAKYETDEEQTTPHRTFVMPCRTRDELSLLKTHLCHEIADFHDPSVFEVDTPVIPEKDFYPQDLLPANGDPLKVYVPQFFATLCEQAEHREAVGEKFWQKLSKDEWGAIYKASENPEDVVEVYSESGCGESDDLRELGRAKKRKPSKTRKR